jgi:hypothetical protein
MDPLKHVIPAAKSPAATLFLGATAAVRRIMPEWISCIVSDFGMKVYYERWSSSYLVMSSSVPSGDLGWIRDLLLQAVCTESTESDGSSARDRAQSPEHDCIG